MASSEIYVQSAYSGLVLDVCVLGFSVCVLVWVLRLAPRWMCGGSLVEGSLDSVRSLRADYLVAQSEPWSWNVSVIDVELRWQVRM